MPPGREQFISWTVITHVHKEHSVDWYWSVGIIAVVAAGVSIWLGNLLFAIIILVAVGSLGALFLRGPREHSVRIDNRGISIDGTLYPYRSIDTFWVERDPEYPRLYLMTHAVVSPHVMLPLESAAQAEQVRSYLKRVVTEKEQDPHFGEHLANMFGL
ncbi:MAG: hypothetical protein Q7R71_00785 [bacterium]|nr:hypothetical protein [bacterium]